MFLFYEDFKVGDILYLIEDKVFGLIESVALAYDVDNHCSSYYQIFWYDWQCFDLRDKESINAWLLSEKAILIRGEKSKLYEIDCNR